MPAAEIEDVRLSDGARLWTASLVRPGAPALVLVHGGPGLWDYLGPVADRLSDVSTYRYDQRGCGRSSPNPEHRIGRYVADLEALRRHHGLLRWNVFGHSFGATIALAYAAAHPESVSALILCSGVGLDWSRYRPTYLRRARARLTDQQAARLAELEEAGAQARTWAEEVEWRTLNWVPDFADPATAQRLAGEAAAVQLRVEVASNRALTEEAATWGLAGELARCAAVRSRVLVVHGEADPRPLTPVRALVDALPDADLEVLDGAGHHPWVERPEEFTAAVSAFLHG